MSQTPKSSQSQEVAAAPVRRRAVSRLSLKNRRKRLHTTEQRKAVKNTEYYQWTITTNGVEQDSASQQYLSKSICQEEGNAMAKVYMDEFGWQDVKVRVTSTMAEAPTWTDLYKAAYASLTKREVGKMSTDNCYGCLVDHPSQIQHLDWPTGCLLPFPVLLEGYGVAAFNSVKKEDVAALAEKVDREQADFYELYPQTT